jgi:glycosyltransferase involved in cell wall biosynthesis
VLTTCASDYVTWRNELPAGHDTVNGVAIRRFPVRRQRDPLEFGRASEEVFSRRHSVADELHWLDAEGPDSPALLDYVSKHFDTYDFLIVFSYRYHHAYHTAVRAAAKTILVPTAERDPAVGLSIFGSVFRGVRAVMYNSPEERAMIQAVAHNGMVPSVVAGIGSEIPTATQSQRFRQKYNIRGPYAVYVGRIDENKGCGELFDYFSTYLGEGKGKLSLVLIGKSILPVPQDPRVRHLGFLDDVDKFDAITGAEVLVMPSYYESLSMVALEAWALGRPVLANGRCDVLRGQCVRSNAGLYYDNRQEFVEGLRALERTRWLNVILGRNGREFYREHYDWPVIERKYLTMLERLAASPATQGIEPLPGWFERRQRDKSAAADILATVPAGPVVTGEPASPSPSVAEETRVTPSGPAAPGPRSAPSRPHVRERRGPNRGRPHMRGGRP